jgi:hypothetical protein
MTLLHLRHLPRGSTHHDEAADVLRDGQTTLCRPALRAIYRDTIVAERTAFVGGAISRPIAGRIRSYRKPKSCTK